MAAYCGPLGLRQMENVVAVKECCVLFISLDIMHCLSLGVVFLYVGPYTD